MRLQRSPFEGQENNPLAKNCIQIKDRNNGRNPGGKKMCRIFAGQDPDNYQPVTRRLRLNGQSTSIRLESSFWEIVDGIARHEDLTTPAFVSKLHSEVLELRGEATNFTSLLRCACLIRQQQISEAAQPIAAE